MKNKIKLTEFLALNKSMYSMLIMVILLGMGEKMAERFLPLYLVVLGGSMLAPGMLNALDNLLSALYSFPGGILSEKLGYKKALQLFSAIAIFGFAIVVLIPVWQAVFIGALFFISWTAITLPAIMGLVSKAVKKDKRTMGVTVHSFVRRIPMALGPVAGGTLISVYGDVKGIRLAFVAAIIMGLLSMIFVHFFMEDKKAEKTEEQPIFSFFRNIKGPLLSLLISDILIRFAEQIPYAYAVIWVVSVHKFSGLDFSLFTVIEMVTAMLVYIPVAYFADKSTKKPFVFVTFIFFALFPLVLFLSNNFYMFIFAFFIRGLKEFGEPTRKALIMDLSPENGKAGTYGAYYLIRDVIVSISAFAGAFLWSIGPAYNLLTAFGFGVLGLVLFGIFGKDLEK